MARQIQPRPIQIGNVPLDAVCGNCQGVGTYYNESYEEEFQRWETSGMLGRQPQDYLWCEECEGIGFHPTEEGLAILALIRRYVKF